MHPAIYAGLSACGGIIGYKVSKMNNFTTRETALNTVCGAAIAPASIAIAPYVAGGLILSYTAAIASGKKRVVVTRSENGGIKITDETNW
jgi:hypothetical protein